MIASIKTPATGTNSPARIAIGGNHPVLKKTSTKPNATGYLIKNFATTDFGIRDWPAFTRASTAS